MSNQAGWIYIATFSTGVEYLKRVDEKKVLGCRLHPSVIGDIQVIVILSEEEVRDAVFKLPYKSYSDDLDQSNSKFGGLHITKVKHHGTPCDPDMLKDIRQTYGL